MRPRTCLSAALPLLLLAGAACSGDDGAVEADDGTGEGRGLLATVSGALDTLPDTGTTPADATDATDGGDTTGGTETGAGEGRTPERILWGDFEEAAELAGIERRPTRPRDDDAPPYIRAVTGGYGGFAEGGEPSPVALVPPEVVHAELADELMAFDDDVGWTLLDVDRFVERTTAPGVVSVLQGGFDDEDMNEALGLPVEGVWLAGAAEDHAEDPNAATAARPRGESQWLARDGDYLTIARAEGDSAAVRRSLAGVAGTPTFADDEGLAGVAEALDAQSPYGAVLERPGPVASGRVVAPSCLPSRTTAVGTGIADEDGPVFLVALAHATPEEAAATADAFPAIVSGGASTTGVPLGELVTLDSVATTGDGRVVVARLLPAGEASSLLWYQFLTQGDPVVSSC